jgi:hypothetical protein
VTSKELEEIREIIQDPRCSQDLIAMQLLTEVARLRGLLAHILVGHLVDDKCFELRPCDRCEVYRKEFG